MSPKEKAQIILEELDEYVVISTFFEEYYMKGILKGLKKIQEAEANE